MSTSTVAATAAAMFALSIASAMSDRARYPRVREVTETVPTPKPVPSLETHRTPATTRPPVPSSVPVAPSTSASPESGASTGPVPGSEPLTYPGLSNTTNKCFAISLMQALASFGELTRAARVDANPDKSAKDALGTALGLADEHERDRMVERTIQVRKQLVEVLNALGVPRGARPDINFQNLLRSLHEHCATGNANWTGSAQQDAQELYLVMMQCIFRDKGEFKRLLHFEEATKKWCQPAAGAHTALVIDRKEGTECLMMALTEPDGSPVVNGTMQGVFDKHFELAEWDGQNASCHHPPDPGTGPTEQNRLGSLPDVLCINLKRFHSGTNRLDTPIRLSESLKVDGRHTEGAIPERMYDLIACTCHSGAKTPHSGHYWTYCKRPSQSNENKWFECNDKSVIQVTWDHVARESEKTSYLLFFRSRK